MARSATPMMIDAPSIVSAPDAWTFIDVRSPAEFETQRIDGSYNVPLDVLKGRLDEVAERTKDAPVLLVCQSGVRAVDAHRALADVGVSKAKVLDGGLSAFAAAGGSTVGGKAKWAIERQVRLVAGSLVLASLLASGKLPKARLVAGAIGGGLTFSALSNTCAMASVLLKLPYNRGPRDRDANYYLAQLPH